LRLMLRTLPHPRQLILCDLYGKLDRREIEGILEEGQYRGSVETCESRPAVPVDLYGSTLIIGATNVPDVLDVERLEPGTIVVDDSGPHCFPIGSAVKRLETQRDILVTEGGVLQSPIPVIRTRHVPRGWEPFLSQTLTERLARSDPRQITGCVLSSLLTAHFDDIEPTLGIVPV